MTFSTTLCSIPMVRKDMRLNWIIGFLIFNIVALVGLSIYTPNTITVFDILNLLIGLTALIGLIKKHTVGWICSIIIITQVTVSIIYSFGLSIYKGELFYEEPTSLILFVLIVTIGGFLITALLKLNSNSIKKNFNINLTIQIISFSIGGFLSIRNLLMLA